MKRSKTSRSYVTVPKLRIKSKKSRYEKDDIKNAAPFENVLDNTENTTPSDFGEPEKDLLSLTDDEKSTSEKQTDEESTNEELTNKKSPDDEDSTDEELLTNKKSPDDEDSTNDEESIGDELTYKKSPVDGDSTDEDSSDEKSKNLPERTNRVSINILIFVNMMEN